MSGFASGVENIGGRGFSGGLESINGGGGGGGGGDEGAPKKIKYFANTSSIVFVG